MGKFCGKFLQEILAEKNLWEILAGKSCIKFLWENLVGQGGGEKTHLRKAVVGRNLAFRIA